MTDRLSTGDPGGQRPSDGNSDNTRKILPFNTPVVRVWNDQAGAADGVTDAVAADRAEPLPGGPRGDDDEFDYDADTVVDDGDGSGAHFPDGFDGDDDRDPSPPAAPAALVIRAPRGPQPVTPGFTVAAVVLYDDDGEENVEKFGFLTPQKMQTKLMAVGVANFKAMRPEKLPVKGATHIVVNDETGREVYRRPILQAA